MWQLFFTFYFLCGKYLYYGIEFCGVFRYIKVNKGKQHIMSKTNKISDSEVKEIINDGGWFDLVPTVDYKYIDGQGLAHPSCCILIPKKYYGEFLKMIKK